MWRSEWSSANNTTSGGDRMNFSDGDLFGGARGWEERERGAGEHSLAGARRAREEDIVVAGHSYSEGALGGILVVDMVEFYLRGNGLSGLCARGYIVDGRDGLEMEKKLPDVIYADNIYISDKRGFW